MNQNKDKANQKVFLILTCFLFINITNIFSQSDLREGYIIKKDNDTIHGWIDYRSSKKNSEECLFKQHEDGGIMQYKPDQLIGYRFTDSKYYLSKDVQLNGEKQIIFLEFLINGIIDIYFYINNFSEYYFVDTGDGQLIELKNKQISIFNEGKNYTKESKEYVGQLKYIFNQNFDIAKEVDNVTLDSKSLKNITKKYHNSVCQDACIIYENKTVPKTKKFGLLLGVNFNTIHYNIRNRPLTHIEFYLSQSNFNVSITPSIGFFYKQNMPKTNERLYIQYDFIYHKTKLHSLEKTFNEYDGLTHVNSIDLTRHSLNNSLSLKYETPRGKFRPTYQIGGFLNYFVKTNYLRESSLILPSGTESLPIEYTNNPFTNFDFGLNFGIGLNLKLENTKELFLDLKYQRGLGLLIPLVNSNYLSLNIGYELGK